MRLLRRLFSSDEALPTGGDVAIAPERTVYVIGDVHGRDDLLVRLLEKIEADAAKVPADPPVIILVGDYVDRGEDSAAVLRRVFALDNASEDVICLLGNHECMLLDFIDAASDTGGRWLRHGGLQTLGSFGIGGVTDTSPAAALEEAAAALAIAMGDDLVAWLRNRPLDWQSGNLVVTHAALDPELPVDSQPDRFKLWGHPEFMQRGGPPGLWVAHGHVIVDLPEARKGRISVDTGAVFTGKLTAAVLRPGGEPEFIQT
ncbi:MAG: metallophosphoesterase [Paracoccaceae bacterium]